MSADIDVDDEFDRLLDAFISNELKDVEVSEYSSANKKTDKKSEKLVVSERREEPEVVDEPIVDDEIEENTNPIILSETEKLIASLASEEQALFNAYTNFANAIIMMCEPAGLEIPNFSLEPEELLPRYKPFVANLINEELLMSWDILLKIYPDHLQNLNPMAGDDELLNFAEKETDELLQLAIISYVETLIEMESCDIAYEARRVKAKKRRIERKIREEHEARQAKIRSYIEKIEDKRFPINAERLVINYFKTARKDPEGAYQILVNNPATYAPIETDKIPDRFFGMIKSKPEDGIKYNHKIGEFMKNLKA